MPDWVGRFKTLIQNYSNMPVFSSTATWDPYLRRIRLGWFDLQICSGELSDPTKQIGLSREKESGPFKVDQTALVSKGPQCYFVIGVVTVVGLRLMMMSRKLLSVGRWNWHQCNFAINGITENQLVLSECGDFKTLKSLGTGSPFLFPEHPVSTVSWALKCLARARWAFN